MNSILSLASRPALSDDSRIMKVALAMGLVGALAAFFGASCGGGGGGSCSTPMAPMACGGDIVGTWAVTSSCVHFTGPIGDSTCPAATLEASVEYSGTVSYTAAMTYTQDVTVSGSETIVIPASCLAVSCAAADQMFQSSPPPGTTSIHCASAGSGCNCNAVLGSAAAPETGTYTLSGTGITTTSSAGETETDQYCVMGNHLDIMPGPNSGSPGDTASGSIALTKQ